ncbi:hypothetical protein C8J56DRAFT_1165407 [Mycena floridula]|nr:hypothetical protein C8J56DRAFT_1165407 [Mycena floridula]
MSSPIPDPAMAQAIIEAYAHGIRTSFCYFLPATIFSAMLIPLLIMLFAVSTPQTRRKPIFMLNITQILLGIAAGIITAHSTIQGVLQPSVALETASENFVISTLFLWTPWITEAILLLRVIVVFSSTHPRLSRMVLLLALPVVFKTIRIVINIVVMVHWWKTRMLDGSEFGAAHSLDTWMPKASWILELVDNGYVSFLFLWRLSWHGDKPTLRRVETQSSKGSLSSNIKTLFWIASTNFFFPPVFLTCQIILSFNGQDTLLGIVNILNAYVSIISTVFATVWSSTISYQQADNSPSVEASCGGTMTVMERSLEGIVRPII